LQAEKNSEPLLECKICGLKSKNLSTHINRIHNLTATEYKAQFPDALVLIKDLRVIEKMKCTIAKSEASIRRKTRKKEKLDYLESVNVKPVICQICGQTSPLSICSHVTNVHGMKLADYRKQFPDAVVQVVSPAQAEKQQLAMTNRVEYYKSIGMPLPRGFLPSEIQHWTTKGYSIEEAKKKVSEFQLEQALKCSNNPLSLEKLSKASSGINNPMSLQSIATRHGVSLQEARLLTPAIGRTGEKHPMFGKKHTEAALKLISSAAHLTSPSFRSKGEIELEEECKKISDIEHNISVKNWNVDIKFISKKLIVEFFGDFWHMHPQKYKETDIHRFMKKTAQQVWARDIRKLNELREQWYEVVVIWEREWRSNKEECLQRVKDAYNRTL
jgi:predicted transcriptional regulator